MRPWHKPVSCLVLLGALLATVARTVRLPNDWAEAHWLLDYRFGFVKRGLAGQLLAWVTGLFGGDVGETTIAVVSLALFAVFVLGLLVIALRIVQGAGWHVTAVAAMVVFLSSPFVVMTAHVVGYFDHLFLSLGLVSVGLATRGRILAGATVQAAALFVHESCLLLTLPAFLLAAAQHAADAPRPGERPPSLWPLLLPLVAAAVIVAVVGAPPPGFQFHYGAWLRQHPFVENDFSALTPQMLAMSLGDYAAVVMPMYGARMAQPGSFGLVLPTVMVMLLFLRPRLQLRFLSLEVLALAGVVLLPQVMHLVAFDLERLWTYSIFTMFVVVWIHARCAGDPERNSGLLPVAMLALVANFVMETPLLDSQFDRMPRAWRVALLLLVLLALGAMAASTSAVSWRERLKWRGRSLLDLLRGRAP